MCMCHDGGLYFVLLYWLFKIYHSQLKIICKNKSILCDSASFQVWTCSILSTRPIKSKNKQVALALLENHQGQNVKVINSSDTWVGTILHDSQPLSHKKF